MEFMDLRADMKAITNLPSRVQWVKTHEARRLVKVSALCLVWCFNTDGQEGYLSRKIVYSLSEQVKEEDLWGN